MGPGPKMGDVPAAAAAEAVVAAWDAPGEAAAGETVSGERVAAKVAARVAAASVAETHALGERSETDGWV